MISLSPKLAPVLVGVQLTGLTACPTQEPADVQQTTPARSACGV
jgi:hypothetical protein